MAAGITDRVWDAEDLVGILDTFEPQQLGWKRLTFQSYQPLGAIPCANSWVQRLIPGDLARCVVTERVKDGRAGRLIHH